MKKFIAVAFACLLVVIGVYVIANTTLLKNIFLKIYDINTEIQVNEKNIYFNQLSEVEKEIYKGIKNSISLFFCFEFRGFGAFSVRKRAPRVAKNPRTGATVEVNERNIAHFKTGKELHEMLNQ